jgi:hypothetical protein
VHRLGQQSLPESDSAMSVPQDQIVSLEEQIERLADSAERCRKLIFAAKLSMAFGGVLLCAFLFGFVQGPELLIATTVLLIGGVVAFGSNTATLDQVRASLAAAEAQRAQLIGGIHLRLVTDDDAPTVPRLH